jgi:intein-encoded DNA endonuclease-like protein
MTSLSLYTKLETLPAELKKEAKNFIEMLVKKTQNKKGIVPDEKKTKREFGSLKGKIHLKEDFDAPLDDFKDYM